MCHSTVSLEGNLGTLSGERTELQGFPQQPAIFKCLQTGYFTTSSEHTLPDLVFSSTSHQALSRSQRAESTIPAETPRQQFTLQTQCYF